MVRWPRSQLAVTFESLLIVLCYPLFQKEAHSTIVFYGFW